MLALGILKRDDHVIADERGALIAGGGFEM
jgi:hypothetical protein